MSVNEPTAINACSCASLMPTDQYVLVVHSLEQFQWLVAAMYGQLTVIKEK